MLKALDNENNAHLFLRMAESTFASEIRLRKTVKIEEIDPEFAYIFVENILAYWDLILLMLKYLN